MLGNGPTGRNLESDEEQGTEKTEAIRRWNPGSVNMSGQRSSFNFQVK